jgi:hypothetical protein
MYGRILSYSKKVKEPAVKDITRIINKYKKRAKAMEPTKSRDVIESLEDLQMSSIRKLDHEMSQMSASLQFNEEIL